MSALNPVPNQVIDLLTKEEFQAALPDKVKKSVGQDIIDAVNANISNPDEYEHYRDNLLSFGSVMADGKFKIETYLSAVKYVSHKLAGRNNGEAYALTFPEKFKRYAAQGTSSKDISSYCTAWHKSKLVTLLMAQSLTPAWIINQDAFQTAINVQFELATTAKSEKVRSDAANSLLTHLKQPETAKVEVNLKTNDGKSTIEILREATLRLVAEQRLKIEAGAASALEIAEQPLILEHDGEVV
jgi:hypothetical protein